MTSVRQAPLTPDGPPPGGPPPRRLRPVQVVVVLVVVVVAIVVGDRLDGGTTVRPDRPQRSAAPTPPPSPSPSQGRLSGLTTAENNDLDRCVPGHPDLVDCGAAPQFRGISRWFNTPGGKPVDLRAQRGKVILLDFFAYACQSCRRDQTYLSGWDGTYRKYGLRVIGMQSPHWRFESDAGNVAAAVKELGITYPVGLDDKRRTYDAYRDRFWPAKYLIDDTGTVRAITFGTGGYQQVETQIRQMLRVARPGIALPPRTPLLAPDEGDGQAAEIYFGYAGATSYVGSPDPLTADRPTAYSPSVSLRPSQFTLAGTWTAGNQSLRAGAGARLVVSFATMRASLVVSGTGTLRIHEPGRPTRTLPIRGRPGPVLLFTGRLDLGPSVTFDVSPGLQLYALSVR